MTKYLLCVGVALLLCGGAAQAGITLPVTQIDVSLLQWYPLSGEGPILCPTASAALFKNAKQVDTPTNVNEIVPWAKANLRLDLAFEFADNSTLGFCGAGVSESVKIAQLGPAPIRAGIGYLASFGTSWYIGATIPLK